MPIGVSLVLAGVSALMMVVAVPLIRRRVAPNFAYGLRVPATFADEWVWYEANARTGRDLFVLGAILFALALLLPLLPVSPETFGLIWAAFCVAGAVGTGIVGWIRANRLLRARRELGPLTQTRP
jgi:uncharacterized membrane protein